MEYTRSDAISTGKLANKFLQFSSTGTHTPKEKKWKEEDVGESKGNGIRCLFEGRKEPAFGSPGDSRNT